MAAVLVWLQVVIAAVLAWLYIVVV